MPTWLPYALIGLFFLSGVGLLIYFFLGGEEVDEEEESAPGADTLMMTADGTKDPLASTAEEFRSTARKSRMIALKESLERSLDSREGEALSSKDRMSMPWFMLVGADGSGKKTILGNTGLPLPWGPPLEVDSQRKDAGKWWLFTDAVVLEAPPAAPGATVGAQTLPPGATVSDTSVGWNTLLHMLRRERPDSPLNGIIVTISCADLMSARVNPERMEEQADRIRNFLERTRKFLGVRLPLHVLVTKCDTLPGFRSFSQALPEPRRNDIFGWANPNDVEAKFEPAWVDKGFTQIQEHLTVLRDEVLAAPEEVRDSVGVFVFDSEFSDLQEPLKAFVARLMTIGERRPSLFFRGFYFTGDVVESSTEAATTLPEGKTVAMQSLSTEVATEQHKLVFLKTLFSEKIFKEAGLARPAARLRLARDRRVVVAQAAAIIIALVGGGGLWMSVNGYRRDKEYRPGLKQDAELLTRVLSGVAIDLDELRRGGPGPDAVLDRRARDAAVIEMVAQMREVPTMRVRSPFIPTSWFSPLPNEIRASMMAGVQNIVLPVTRERLQERALRLLSPRTPADSVISDELDASDPRTLTTYLGDVRTLSRNIARYNSLAGPRSGSVAELSALLDYLFGERLATDSSVATPDFEEALRLAEGQSIRVSGDMAAAVVRRSVAMIAAVTDSAARQLAPRATAAADRAVRPEDDLEALRGLAALVELIDPKRGVVATVSDSAILGVKLARAVEDSIKAQLTVASQRIVPRDTAAPDSAFNRLRSAISGLYQFRLMERVENRRIAADIRARERLRWDLGRLELALALPTEFLQAVVAIAPAFPGQSPDRVKRALEVQLRARTIDVAASAQRFTSTANAVDQFVEVTAQGDNIQVAMPRLLRLASALDTLRARSEARALLVAGARQAEHALAVAQRAFDRGEYFEPQTAGIASWPGVIPIGFKALGATDQVRFASQLSGHEDGIKKLVDGVAPAIRYLRLPQVADSLRVPRLLSDWEVISGAVVKYNRGDITSTLWTLHQYLKDGMTMTDPAACAITAALPDTIKPSADFFVVRRRQFQAALVSRCRPGSSAEAANAYQRLRSLFHARLAGRYPFVDSAGARAPDADPAAVREFLRQYDAFAVTGDVTLRSDPNLVPLMRDAGAFLDNIAMVREFMAPFAQAGADRNLPELTLLIGPGTAARSDSVPMELELQLGGRRLTLDEVEHEELWRSGDAIRMVLTPIDTTRARTVFIAGGAWAALKLGQQAGGLASLKFFDPDTKVELALPQFPIAAPDIALPSAQRPVPAPVVAPPVVAPAPQTKTQPPAATKAAPGVTKTRPNVTKTKARPNATKAAPPRGSKAAPRTKARRP